MPLGTVNVRLVCPVARVHVECKIFKIYIMMKTSEKLLKFQ